MSSVNPPKESSSRSTFTPSTVNPPSADTSTKTATRSFLDLTQRFRPHPSSVSSMDLDRTSFDPLPPRSNTITPRYYRFGDTSTESELQSSIYIPRPVHLYPSSRSPMD